MNDKPTIAPLGDFPDHEPTENSPLGELAAYALDKQRQIITRDTENGEDLWLMGQALEWAKKKLQYGEWEDWFDSQGLRKTWVWQARKLHKNATLDEVKELGMTEALRKFKVLPEKQGTGTKASASKKNNDENDQAVPANGKETEEPNESPEPSDDTEQPTQAGEPSGEDDGDEGDTNGKPSDDLAADEDKELKAYQESIRTLTPKTRAVVIHHALELLREEINGEEVDEEMQQTFGQIAQLAEELKGLNSHDGQDS